MPAKLKIAVSMELEWPYKRHYETFAGIREYTAEIGNWELHLTDFPQVELSRGTHFDGIVGRIRKRCHEAANEAGIPTVNVTIGTPVPDSLPCVHVDYREAGKMAAEHLVVRGLRRLVHIGFYNSVASQWHYQGMKEVADKHNASCVSHLVRHKFNEDDSYWATFIDLIDKLQKSWKPPMGIGFASDELAHATTTLLQQKGWKVPEEIAVVGTNNEVLICNASKPSLSSIEMSDRRCGYEAARLLNQLINDPDTYAEPILVPPKKLVLRGSSDAYAVEDSAVLSALRFMVQHLGDPISVPDIARASGIGRQSLERRFRNLLKRTINDELIRLRISKMKRLLVETDHNISEISDIVGFGTTANMNVMFKRKTGMTPVDYRKRHISPPITPS